MRSTFLWLVTLWLCASPLAAQPSPVPAAQAAPAIEAPGTLLVIVLAGRRLAFLPDVQVSASGQSAISDARGKAALLLAPGEHDARIVIAGRTLELPRAPVVSREHTLVLVTLDEQGGLLEASVRPPAAPPEPAPTPQLDAAAAAATPGELPAPSAPHAEGGESALSGRILSQATGKPIAGAAVYVLGTELEAASDADGRFIIALAPGDHTVSIVHLEHTGQTLEAIQVAPGATTELRVELTPAPLEMETFVVRARRLQGSTATVLEDRRKSAAVTDGISSEDIRRSADGTASAATRRIVGASVVGGQFLFVRGLGGRYSNVRLNGIPLPSTDPDLPGFQLDLFPASLLSSLTITKTFTPDIPGDFTGGSMNVVTRDFPTRFDLSASVGLASDTETIGRDILSYDGGGLDWLGIDDGTRAMPDAVPARVVKGGRTGLSNEEVADVGSSFANVWETEPTAALPNLSLGFSIGDTLRPGGRRLGLLFTLGYRYNVSRSIETLSKPTANALRTGERVEELVSDSGSVSAQTGMLGSASYELAEGHNLTLVSLLTQTGDDKSSLVTGFSIAENMPMRRTQLRYVERRLLFEQLLGKHDLTDLVIDWQLNLSSIERDQPDTRSLAYFEGPAGYFFRDVAGSGDRLFTNLTELGLGGGADLTVPIDDTSLKAGYLGSISDRDYTMRRFGTDFIGQDSSQRSLPPGELLTPENSGVLWRTNELTAPRDGYAAEQELHAAYGSADVPVLSFLRLTGGARVEVFSQFVEPVAPAEGLTTLRAEDLDRSDADLLPAGSAIISVSDSMGVRLAYGGTVARPLLRELSPSPIPDFVRRRTVQGNPDLKRTYVHNFDVRWEMFPGATEVLAASAFYKVFQDPIEPVAPSDTALTFENVPSAQNYGLELEGRAGLDRVWSALEGLVLTANLALIRSRVELSDEQVMRLTSQERPLAGQSPYIVNLGLSYAVPGSDLSMNLLYNVFGRRIAEVGVSGLPDVYELPYHSLDFTASYQLDEHFTLGASASNLLLQRTVLRQDRYDFSSIDRGMGFGIRLGYAR